MNPLRPTRTTGQARMRPLPSPRALRTLRTLGDRDLPSPSTRPSLPHHFMPAMTDTRPHPTSTPPSRIRQGIRVDIPPAACRGLIGADGDRASGTAGTVGAAGAVRTGLARAAIGALDTVGRASAVLAVGVLAALGTSSALAAAGADPALNPYGLQAMWQQGDLVSRGTLILLVLMSLASWTAIVARLLDQQRVLRETRQAAPGFWQAPTAAEGAKQLSTSSVLGFIAGQCLAADAQHVDGMAASVDRHTWIGLRMERAVAQVQSRMQRGLALLATVASTAPFVGLFGTVWGIYHALVAIGVSGQASIDKVAGPVGEALIMTAIGLAVAVPAVMGHNALVRRNKLVMDEVRAFGADLHEVLVAGRPDVR